MHTALSKTNCSTICIEIIRSQLLEQGWMLIVLLLLRNNTFIIWSQHNLDLIEDNCDPHCSEDRILCTVYTGTCPPPVLTLITATGDLDWPLPPAHSIRCRLTKRKELWIECLEYLGKAFPIIWLMLQILHRGSPFDICSAEKLRHAFCLVSEMEPFSFTGQLSPCQTLTLPQWLYKRRVVNGSITLISVPQSPGCKVWVKTFVDCPQRVFTWLPVMMALCSVRVRQWGSGNEASDVTFQQWV